MNSAIIQEKLDKILPLALEEMLKIDAGRLDELTFKQATSIIYEVALNRWLLEDLDNWEYIDEPELSFEYLGTKGIIDLTGVIKSDPPDNAYKPYAGQRFIVDWKTSSTSVLSDNWKFDYLNSWQWRIYSAAKDAKLFIYRGMTRGELDITRAVKTIQIAVPDDVSLQVEEHMRLTRLQLNALTPEPVWPRNWPGPCRKWSGCPFYSDCFSNQRPEKLITIPELISYSKLSAFAECPEKYRRLVSQPDDLRELDANENTIFGNVVHAGLAKIYKEMFHLKD